MLKNVRLVIPIYVTSLHQYFKFPKLRFINQVEISNTLGIILLVFPTAH